MHIRKVTLNDAFLLQQIARQTFSDTFSGVNSRENMEKYLAERLSLEALKAELANEHSEFYFAEEDQKIIG